MNSNTNLRIRADASMTHAGENEFVVRVNGDSYLFRGAVYGELLKYLTGEYPEETIVSRLKNTVSLPEVFYAIGRLEDRGILVRSDSGISRNEESAFFDPLGGAVRNGKSPAIHLVSYHSTSKSALFLERLRDAAVRFTIKEDGQNSGKLSILITDSYEDREFQNRAIDSYRTMNTPILPISVGNHEVWIGPLWRPGISGCPACLFQRIGDRKRGREEVFGDMPRNNDGIQLYESIEPAFEPALNVFAGIATVEIERIVRTETSSLDATLAIYSSDGFRRADHPVIVRPQCPVCGDARAVKKNQESPIQLKSASITGDDSGGFRIQREDDTFNRLKNRMGPITGIVGNLQRVESGGTHLHTYISDHNFALHREPKKTGQQGIRSRSAGKGITDIQAKTGALCEAIERYSGLFTGEESVIRATMADLGDKAIDPRNILLFSDRQYAERDGWNARDSIFNHIPEPFDPEQSVLWSPVWSLNSGQMRYVPTALCYYNVKLEEGHNFARGDANGCAVGNTLEEAILQGYLELVERDAVAIWWYNRIRRPAVDLDSFRERYLDDLRRDLDRMGRNFWVLDLTSDLGIPVFAAISANKNGSPEEILFGFGAHLNVRIALLRAVTEHNQILPAIRTKDENGNTIYPDPEGTAWWSEARLSEEQYLVPMDGISKKKGDYTPIHYSDIAAAVRHCMEGASELGIEVFALDQTRPDTGLHAVRVIAPGLRHFWARYAPGRLYDVPVKMKDLSTPRTEKELNPWPMFL